MEANSKTITVGDVELDLARGEIRRDGSPLAVEPQVFALIAYLAANPNKILSRDDLIEAVWGGRIVSDSAIASRINTARKILGDDGNAQKYIRTIPKRGFRFEVDGANAESRVAMATAHDKSSIAVLPFRNLSGDPEQAYFSDGITDDIIIGLARNRELFVIARQSSFAYRDGSTPLSDIADALGVQYLLEGGVRRSGQRIRVTAQLVDPTNGAHLWAERYDRSIEDIFEVQDDITAMIVNTLVGEISRDGFVRSMTKSAEKVNAYDHFLRASEFTYRAGREDVRLAREEALKAITLDPGLARAHAVVAWTLISEFMNAWTDDPEACIEKARRHALTAVETDIREPLGHAVLGWVYMCLKEFERGLEAQRRAIADNPGNAIYRGLHGFTLAYSGYSEEAIETLENAMLLNPGHPDLYNVHYGRALFNLRRYEDAMRPLEKARTAQPGNGNALALAAACYAALGRMDEAREALSEFKRVAPEYTLDYARRYLPFRREGDLEHFLEHLTLAGMDK